MGWSGGKSSVQLIHHTMHKVSLLSNLQIGIPSVRTEQLVVNAHAIILVLYGTLSCYAMSSGGGGQPGTPGQCHINIHTGSDVTCNMEKPCFSIPQVTKKLGGWSLGMGLLWYMYLYVGHFSSFIPAVNSCFSYLGECK